MMSLRPLLVSSLVVLALVALQPFAALAQDSGPDILVFDLPVASVVSFNGDPGPGHVVINGFDLPNDLSIPTFAPGTSAPPFVPGSEIPPSGAVVGVSNASTGAFGGAVVGSLQVLPTVGVAQVPEPTTIMLMALGVAGVITAARRQGKAALART
jgi:PEP-CTERM motif-containing protein